MESPGVIFWNSKILTHDLFFTIPNVVEFFSEQYFLLQTHQIGSPGEFLEIPKFWPQAQFVLAIPNVVEGRTPLNMPSIGARVFLPMFKARFEGFWTPFKIFSSIQSVGNFLFLTLTYVSMYG